jgi:hypothetical protein
VVHRNGSVTVALRRRPRVTVETRFDGPLWLIAVRFWIVMLLLSGIAWWNASGRGGHLGGPGADHDAWLIPVLTFLGGAVAVEAARLSGALVRDRRPVFSAWTIGLLLSLPLSLLIRADYLGVVLAGGVVCP